MLKKLSSWMFSNKLTAILVLILLFFVYQSFLNRSPFYSGGMPAMMERDMAFDTVESAASPVFNSKMEATTVAPMPPMYGGSTNVSAQDRKVIRESNVSLLVKDVRQSVDSITQQVSNVGGFIVSSSVHQPDEGGSGNVTLRVPADKANETLAFLRSHAVQVVSENIFGNDVTDQYQDVASRLATLERTKQTFETMLSSANTIEEILQAQQSIFSVQDQIDSLKGQQKYLEDTSSTVLIQAYLSTDELALPYSPSDPWRPQVVFKTSVRSLVGTLRDVAELAIWSVVYLPVVLILGLVFYAVNRFLKSRSR